ncbi:MAG TPA: DNA repair protein RecO [Steroidobacteraceae bacterium]|jgi:DNA repair protein RecO (recombination protein O)|nr:DNA repair protein RecO [Steroidobacteraceae bacterium]
MSGNTRHVDLTPAYVLHHQPWRDTSRIFEVLTRDFGRLSLFARGVRGPKSKLSGVLQPFVPLLLSWRGRGEAPQLINAELRLDDDTGGAGNGPLPPSCILSGFYLSELVMTLTVRHDPQPDIFSHYERALRALKAGAALQRELRLFEKRLLETLGYGIDLAAMIDGGSVEGGLRYHYRPADGLALAVADSPGAAGTGGTGISGSTLRSLAEERLDQPGEVEQARLLLRMALAQCLEGRKLKTRSVARSLLSAAAGGVMSVAP